MPERARAGAVHISQLQVIRDGAATVVTVSATGLTLGSKRLPGTQLV